MPTVLEHALAFKTLIENRTLTLRQLAVNLETNESYLSRILKNHIKKVPSSTKSRQKQQELVEIRRFLREKHAKLVISREKSLKRAAADARCSERTLRRYMEKIRNAA